jgi:hypothetical protein
MARRAGMYAAASAIRETSSATLANVKGSVALMRKGSEDMRRVIAMRQCRLGLRRPPCVLLVLIPNAARPLRSCDCLVWVGGLMREQEHEVSL